MSSPKMISPNTTFPNKLASICIAVAFALSAPQFLFGQYTINTIAGGGPNHIAALSASTGYPESIAFDSAGNAYIAESYASQILEVSVAGTVTVVAGNGTEGYSGDGGPATSAALNQPEGVFVDSSGNIFIADTENSVIREVLASTGNIQTVVGVSYDASNGSACQSGGDGGPALSANLCVPYSVFVDGFGNIFIADFGNSTIREVVASTGNIQTVAGTPGTPGYIDGVLATSAELDLPASVVLDAAGNIIIADTFNSVIRVVNPGATTRDHRRYFNSGWLHHDRRRLSIRSRKLRLPTDRRRRSCAHCISVPAVRRLRG
jgi:trimeric autotransporter adhesin